MEKLLLKNGETIAYRRIGSGSKQILLIHGNMTSSVHYDLLIEELKSRYNILAIDLRGFGESTYHHPVSYISDFSNDVAEVLIQLKIKECHVIGWSTGGGIALQLAADYPELVKKLILVESVGITGYPMFRKDEKGQAILGDFLKTKDEIGLDPVQVLPLVNAYATHDFATLRNIWNALIYTHNQPDEERYKKYLNDMITQRNLVDVDHSLVWFNMSDEHNGVVEGSGDIHKVKAPTLVFQGNRDFVVPITMGEGIRDALGELVKYKTGDWGHSPFVDNLELVSKEVINFIK